MRGARVLSICLTICVTTAAVAADVPAPPSESGLAPGAIFNADSSYVPPDPGTSGTVSPNQVYAHPVSTTSAQQRRYYYMPVSEPASDFPFAGYNGGAVIPIGGKVDELFNGGIQIVFETGWQMSTGNEGMFSAVAITAAFSNQTIWGKDNRSFILPDGSIHGTETLSISTFKSGIYLGNTLGGFDFFTGVYGKVGAAVLNEDLEFFDPFTELTPVNSFKNNAFAGGAGLEAGIALWKFERGSLALIGGVEAMYIDTFDYGGDNWTVFTTTGFQWEFDITDGLCPKWGRDKCPREKKCKQRRRCR